MQAMLAPSGARGPRPAHEVEEPLVVHTSKPHSEVGLCAIRTPEVPRGAGDLA